MNTLLNNIYNGIPNKIISTREFETMCERLSNSYSKVRNITVDIMNYGLKYGGDTLSKGTIVGTPLDLGTVVGKDEVRYAVGISDRGVGHEEMLSILCEGTTVTKDGKVINTTGFVMKYGSQKKIFKDYNENLFRKHLSVYCMYLQMTYGDEFAGAVLLYSLMASNIKADTDTRLLISLFPYICAGAIAIMGSPFQQTPIYGHQPAGTPSGTTIVE